MNAPLILILAGIAILIVLSAFFSGSETALTAASKARIQRLARDGWARAEKVAELIEDRERLIGAILLGNNLVNILASALATSVMITFFGDEGVFYATLIMTAVVLIFAEVLPKTYAISNPDRTALSVGPAIGVIVRLFAPVVSTVQAIVRGTLKLFGIDVSETEHVLSAHEEIRGTIDLQASEGSLRKSHKDMLGSILDLDEVMVEDVMVHRRKMEAIDIEDDTDTIIDQVVNGPHSRLPVYRGETENIVGILHAKDLLRAIRIAGSGDAAVSIEDIMREPWFVPETTTLREQLNNFLALHMHFALVVDEYGALMGLITLEDILEEIVGDIADEFDFESEGIVVEGEDGEDEEVVVIASGTATIRDINRRMDWNLPDEEATTVAGLVIHEAEEIPVVGQKLEFFGAEFEITGRRKNQITQVRIRPISELARSEQPANSD